MSNSKVTRCNICNCMVYEDGTAEDCGGECERELNIEQSYTPLVFDDVSRNLYKEEPLSSWPDMDIREEGDEYENEV